MLNIYLKAKSDGNIKKEAIGAWIYTLLGSKYHDDGLYDYFNGSKVKAHCFSYDKEKVFTNDILLIEIRGIKPVENRISKILEVGNEIRLGKVCFSILEITETELNCSKDIYKIKSPVIMRDNKLVYRYESKEAPTVEELLVNSIKRKYESIYGNELSGLFSIRFLNKSNCSLDIKIRGENVYHKGYLGTVEIIGSTEAKNFILSVGLGNRTGYGCGFIE